LAKDKISTREIAAGMPQGSMLAQILYSLYINDVLAAPGTHLALFMDYTVFTRRRNTNVFFSPKCNAASLQ
jgi:hypothetical protein